MLHGLLVAEALLTDAVVLLVAGHVRPEVDRGWRQCLPLLAASAKQIRRFRVGFLRSSWEGERGGKREVRAGAI